MKTSLDSEIEKAYVATRRTTARLNPGCVVCGSENPRGLRLCFHSNATGISAVWTPTRDWESFTGIIHGGIVATVMDEAMSKAIIARGWEALTVELRTRFHHRVQPGYALSVFGQVVCRQKRKIRAEASIRNAEDCELAHAWGTFLTLSDGSTARNSTRAHDVRDLLNVRCATKN